MKIVQGYTLREIAGEKMILMKGSANLDLTKVVMLNSSAELLWNTFQNQDFLKSEAADLLVSNYDIDQVQAVADAEAWISSMMKAGLIEP
ncbi:MAG: PqqD family protein [Prolixibacteraceae bacterium]